jgi:phosphoadenosine phosphosulfate reductase
MTMIQNSLNIDNLQAEFAERSPQEILSHALKSFDRIAISFSGAEDVVLIDMAHKINPDVQIFSLDTGRLHPETYQLLNKVRNHYKIDVEIIFPDAKLVERLVTEKGLFSFYQDGHKECCGIRKVRPLRRKLATLDGWITGQRQDQNPATRSTLPVIQLDPAFSTDEHQLIKYNPLSNWTSAQVWQYIRANQVPYNSLHDRGFMSIGCEPCTRAISPHQEERAGRWWWENPDDKECGLHATNEAQVAKIDR